MAKHCGESSTRPFQDFPWLNPVNQDSRFCPSDVECFALWHKYGMYENIQCHSLMVAHIATALATRAVNMGFKVNVQEVRASALLHDLAKTWCLKYRGSHAMLGASWVIQETGNYNIAQGVILHVHWPWHLPHGGSICSLPFFILYADKRVKHDKCVTIRERFEDLRVRYGKGKKALAGIMASYEQTKKIQSSLSRYLDCDLESESFPMN